MKKVIRLTEQDLERMVRRIIKESDEDTGEEPRETKYDESPYADKEHPLRKVKGDKSAYGRGENPHDRQGDESAEDFMQDMSKPGIGQKLKQGLRDLSGLSNKNDSETLAQIHNLIKKGVVNNVRRQSVDSITAWLNNKALIVDRGRNPEIIYAGRNLEISNLESEADDLYSELITHL
jgi:hypothetical protein